MKKYVVGLVLKDDEVLLIRKQRPLWQSDGLNGVGGKVKRFENFYEAMVRECNEECNLVITHWNYLGLVTDNSEYVVQFFSTKAVSLDHAQSMTDEPIEIHKLNTLDYSALIPPADVFLRLALNSVFSPIELIME